MCKPIITTITKEGLLAYLISRLTSGLQEGVVVSAVQYNHQQTFSLQITD
jgi:hypothetical protein